jgi:hypothetical protein
MWQNATEVIKCGENRWSDSRAVCWWIMIICRDCTWRIPWYASCTQQDGTSKPNYVRAMNIKVRQGQMRCSQREGVLRKLVLEWGREMGLKLVILQQHLDQVDSNWPSWNWGKCKTTTERKAQIEKTTNERKYVVWNAKILLILKAKLMKLMPSG